MRFRELQERSDARLINVNQRELALRRDLSPPHPQDVRRQVEPRWRSVAPGSRASSSQP